MPLKTRRSIIEIYGLARMILGVGELVGLSAGYFLAEYLINSPRGGFQAVFNKDILALTYLTVIFRSIFHTAAGIGVSRARNWARAWLLYGWPVILLVNYGFLFSLSQDWIAEGLVSGFWTSISKFHVMLYLAWIAFDLVFVSHTIAVLNKPGLSIEETGQDMAIKKLAPIFFGAVLFFSLLMFLGGSVKQGYYMGFYKTSGKKAAAGTQKRKALEKIQPTQKKRLASKPTLAPLKQQAPAQRPVEAQILKEDSIYRIAKTKAPVIKDELTQGTSWKKVRGIKKGEVQTGMPYRKMIGFIGGFCFVVAFLIQILEVLQSQSTQNISLSSFVLFSLGFSMWVFYGIVMHMTAISLTCFLSLLLCIFIIYMKFKYDY